MSAGKHQRAIEIGPVSLSSVDHAAIKWVLDQENKNGNGAHSYVLMENQPADQAQILITSITQENSGHIQQTITSKFGSKSTIFVADDLSVPNLQDNKYVIRQDALGEELIDLIEKASEDKLQQSLTSTGKSEQAEACDISATNKLKGESKKFGQILVVDDSQSVRTQMEVFLTKRKFQCQFAESAEQAIKIVNEKKFNMIFLDVIMPGADGYQTCKAIKSIESAKDTPIIMLTSKNNPIDKIHGIMSGCDEYTIKPIRASELTELLKKYFPNFKKAIEARNG